MNEDKIGNVCDRCGKQIDVSSEGILTKSGELLCMDCQEPVPLRSEGE